jgi:hypothetical protein
LLMIVRSIRPESGRKSLTIMKPEGVIDHRVAAGGGDTGVKDVGVRTGVGVAARAEAWRPGLRQIGTA